MSNFARRVIIRLDEARVETIAAIAVVASLSSTFLLGAVLFLR